MAWIPGVKKRPGRPEPVPLTPRHHSSPAPRPVPAITDPPPAEVVAELAGLREALDRAVPAKRLDRNVLIATWNIRALGGLTEKWRSEADDSPKRDLASVLAIADIISRFDVVAVQELRGNLKALRELLRVLGGDWGLLLTDVTKGQQGQGNDERLGFVFDTRRVKPSGLAAELVIPDEELEDTPIEPGALQRQLRARRTRRALSRPAIRRSSSSRCMSCTAIAPLIAPASFARSRGGWPNGPGARIAITRTSSRWATSTSTGKTTPTGRPSPTLAWPPPPSCRASAARSSTTPAKKASLTRSPGSPKPANAS